MALLNQIFYFRSNFFRSSFFDKLLSAWKLVRMMARARR